MTKTTKTSEDRGFGWAVPKELRVRTDPLRVRLDFHNQAVTMTAFEGETVSKKVVSAIDVAHALAGELTYGTGLMPDNTLFWRNTKSGPVFGLFVEAEIRILSLQQKVGEPPRRFKVPLPPMIFLVQSGRPPWCYAVKKRPTKETDIVYHAPMANVYSDGRSCPGSHRYPHRVQDMVKSFFISFFTATANLEGRSKQFPRNVLHLWEFLDGRKKYPLDDLQKWGTVRDLLNMEI
jgi:hypothetical protein